MRFEFVTKSQVASRKSQVPSPKSQVPSPKSQVPSPKSQVPSLKSQVPSCCPANTYCTAGATDYRTRPAAKPSLSSRWSERIPLRADRLLRKHGKVDQWYVLALWEDCLLSFSAHTTCESCGGSGLCQLPSRGRWPHKSRSSAHDCKPRWDIIKVDEDAIPSYGMHGGSSPAPRIYPVGPVGTRHLEAYANVEQPTPESRIETCGVINQKSRPSRCPNS
jgi:hypothetical protein